MSYSASALERGGFRGLCLLQDKVVPGLSNAAVLMRSAQ